MDGERINGACINKKERSRQKSGAWPVREPQIAIGRLTVRVFSQTLSFPTSTQFMSAPLSFTSSQMFP